MLDLYKNIRKRRHELNISQQELAEAVGYKGKSMISQVEKGLVDLPESMIIKFADALKTTPSWLMGWEEQVVRTSGNASITEVEVQRPSYDPDEVEKAMKLYEQFSSLAPEYQDTLLRMLEAAQIVADLRQTGKDKK